MGESHNYYTHWDSFQDLIQFALSLPGYQQQAFLSFGSAICWIVWKNRNSLHFTDAKVKSVRNPIVIICSMVELWAGMMNSEVASILNRWKPEDLDMIPIQWVGPISALSLEDRTEEPCCTWKRCKFVQFCV